jgi:hypothetical protein
MSRALILLLVSLAASAILGCGGVSTRPYVGGRFEMDEASFYSTLAQAVRRQGYVLEEDVAWRGRMSVSAHTTGSRGRTAHFVVQCYRPGWFQVTAEGTAVRRSGDSMGMSGDMFREYRDFSVALVDAFDAGSEGP